MRSDSTGHSRKAPASTPPAQKGRLTQPSPPSQSTLPQPQDQSAYLDQSSQQYPSPDRAVLEHQDLGQPPPPGGYYAPVGGRLPSTTFVGGRHLSEQQVGEAKHGFESQSGFRGPYHGSSANPRTPNPRYQDIAVFEDHPRGVPTVPQYDIPSVPAIYRRERSDYGAGNGDSGGYDSPQTTSNYAQHPAYNHWDEQADLRTVGSFGSPGAQKAPQISRPDLPSQYSMSFAQPTPPALTPQSTYPDLREPSYQSTHARPYRLEQVAQPASWTQSMPANGTQAPRSHTRNFSLHHQVNPTNQARDYPPQFPLSQADITSPTQPAALENRPPPPPKDPSSRPVSTRTVSIPQHPTSSKNPHVMPPWSPSPPVPPKDDSLLVAPGHRAATTSTAPPNIISLLSSKASSGSLQALHRTGDMYHNNTKPQAEDAQQREMELRNPSGRMAELDAGPREDEEEEIVMSSTSYPGQEWQPSNYGHWDED